MSPDRGSDAIDPGFVVDIDEGRAEWERHRAAECSRTDTRDVNRHTERADGDNRPSPSATALPPHEASRHSRDAQERLERSQHVEERPLLDHIDRGGRARGGNKKRRPARDAKARRREHEQRPPEQEHDRGDAREQVQLPVAVRLCEHELRKEIVEGPAEQPHRGAVEPAGDEDSR